MSSRSPGGHGTSRAPRPERSGRGAREVPCPPGDLLLMRAPGFAGRRDRPFHYLSDVTQARLTLGLRHDLRTE